MWGYREKGKNSAVLLISAEPYDPFDIYYPFIDMLDFFYQLLKYFRKCSVHIQKQNCL